MPHTSDASDSGRPERTRGGRPCACRELIYSARVQCAFCGESVPLADASTFDDLVRLTRERGYATPEGARQRLHDCRDAIALSNREARWQRVKAREYLRVAQDTSDKDETYTYARCALCNFAWVFGAIPAESTLVEMEAHDCRRPIV